MSMVHIYTTNSREELLVIQSMLDAAGIASEARQESVSKAFGLRQDGLGEIRLFVEEEDAEEAKALLIVDTSQS